MTDKMVVTIVHREEPALTLPISVSVLGGRQTQTPFDALSDITP